MRKFKFLLFLSIIFLSPCVYAAEFNMNSYTSATLNGTKNRYRATEIYNTGTSSTYTFGTRYNGQISDIETYFDYPFEENTTYRLTYNMATEDFRNKFGSSYWWDCSDTMNSNNAHVFTPTYVSYKKVQFSFKPTSNTTCIRVWLRSKSVSSTAITGVNNWNLSSITIYDPDWQSGSGSGQGTSSPTPAPTATNDYSSIINNQNNNTQDIINNNNSNTSDIIENNNNNTQEITDTIRDNLNNCRDSYNILNPEDLSIGGISTETGELVYGFFIITNNLIPINNDNSHYSFRYNTYASPQIVIYKYDNNQSFLGFDVIDNNSGFLSISSNVKFLRVRFSGDFENSFNFQIAAGPTVLPFERYGDKICTSKLDDTTNAINQVNESINNDNIDNGVGNDFFSNFDDDDFGLSSIITIPLNTIQSLTSKSCVALQVPIPYTNRTVSLPCMTEVYQQNIPTVYNLWKIVSFGLIAYFIAIDIFHMVKGFKDPESDKVEVLDL